MALIVRIFVIVFALIVACMAAGVALAIGVMLPDWPYTDPFERMVFFSVAFFATSFAGAVAFLPALLAIAVAEALRLRSFLYYAACGAVISLLGYYGSDVSARLEDTTDIEPVGHALQLAAAAGIIGGLVYWLIAGRSAGRWREPLTQLT
jgi:hypothetical protein